MTEPWSTPGDVPYPWTARPVQRFTRTRRVAVHGQGEVWEARLEGSDEPYALKFLLQTPQEEARRDDIRRFQREVRAQSSLIHPGIMPIVASNFEESPPWYVMPFAARSLRDWLSDPWGMIGESESIAVVLTIADALGFAHAQGVIHRDVKPENVLYLTGTWVLSDFGLCRDINADSTTFTMTGAALGTLAYMAPEQWADAHNVGPAADIYALGRVLYECLTRKVPWPAAKIEMVPDRFKYIVARCLADEPADRYPSMEALANDLRALSAPGTDLALPVEHAQVLSEKVAEGESGAAGDLLRFILGNLSDEIFIRTFLPSVTPPVLAAVRAAGPAGFAEVIRRFDQVSEGSQPFSWTDSAALFLERVYGISSEPEIRALCMNRILILGTEHNRWAVRDVYVRIMSRLTSPEEILMVATQLSNYPAGAGFIRPAAAAISLPLAIRAALAA